MPAIPRHRAGTSVLAEMREFASFAKGTQRYIRRSLDIGLGRGDAVRRWSRNDAEAQAIVAQRQAYARLDQLRSLVPDDLAIDQMAPLMSPLIAVSAFDLAQGRLPTFASYRFLYERLIGAAARPWLPAGFCAAASLPHLHPQSRRALLKTFSAADLDAAGASTRPPAFIPAWVEKIDAVIEA